MAKGATVVVGGELVKSNPEYHITHTFQGQKGRDPMTENDGRDPDRDNDKSETMDEALDRIHSSKNDMDEQIAAARHARRPVRSFSDVVNGVPRPPRPTAASIKSLKQTLPKPELGESNEDEDEDKVEDDRVKQLSEDEDDEEMQDDNDVDIAE